MIGQLSPQQPRDHEVYLKTISLVFSVVQGLMWYLTPRFQAVFFPDVAQLPWVTRACLALGRNLPFLTLFVIGHAGLVLFSGFFSRKIVLFLDILLFMMSLLLSVSAWVMPFFVVTGQIEII